MAVSGTRLTSTGVIVRSRGSLRVAPRGSPNVLGQESLASEPLSWEMLDPDQRFGAKSVMAVGDLYQLPAVENTRRKEQVYDSNYFYQYLYQGCSVRPS